MTWKIIYTKESKNDFEKFNNKEKSKVRKLIEILLSNPYEFCAYFKRLRGSPTMYSRRISQKHRLVYEINKEKRVVKVLSMWGHYDDN